MANSADVRRLLERSAAAFKEAAELISGDIAEVGDVVAEALAGGSKVMLCGNGGSAADAQHIAAELAGRLKRERRGLPAISLTVNASVLTAVANDYGYDRVFARQVEALGRPGDVLVGISTSGSSPNVVEALKTAKELGLVTVGLMGRTGGDMEPHCDHVIKAPADDTQRIQEIHIAAGHAVCEIAEDALFNSSRAETDR